MRQSLSALLLFCAFHASAAVTGRVIDEAGKPLRGVRVRVRALETSEQMYARMLSNDPQPQFLATAETNDSGVFRVETKGNAVVELMLDGPGRQFSSQDVADGEDAGTFMLRASPARRGRITAGGRGVANATVAIGRSYVTRTDGEGNYEAAETASGVDRIMVIHRDYAIVNGVVRGSGAPPRIAPPQAGLLTSFDVALQTGTPVRGQVIDARGAGVAGATIRAAGWPLARSGEDGSFEIPHAATEKPPLFAREGNRVGMVTKPPYVIRLRPAATITGSVRSNKDESAIAGARVLIRADFDESWWPSAISDPKGNFVIDGADPSARMLFASQPAFFGMGGPSDLRLEEGTRIARTIYLTPLARLAGKVIDEEQHPVAAARVSYLGSGGATTATDGTFSLRLPGLERATMLNVNAPSFPMTTFGPYSIEAGETKSGLLLRLARGFKFELRLVDRDGVPIASEPVTIVRRTDSEVRRMMIRIPVPCGANDVSECRTDDQGKLAVTIGEGSFDLTLGGETTVVRELPDQKLTARSSPMTFELERGTTVEGRVVWSDGAPANLRGNVATIANPPASALVTDGAFALRNVAPGKLTLVFESAPPAFAHSEPFEVTAPASGVLVKLPRPGRIEGRVVDRETDKPVTSFSVELRQRIRSQTPPPKSFRADDGRFVMEDVAPGTYDLTVSANGYTRANNTAVNVEEAKAVTVPVTLDRGGVVTGRVASEGRPLADVSVSLVIEGRSPASRLRTDANGEYKIDGLMTGPNKLDVRRDGFVSKVVSVTAEAGKETRLDIDLARALELRGRVVDAVGKPVPNAEISSRGSTPFMMMAVATSDTEGSFRLGGLGDLTYTITVSKEGYADGTLDVNPASAGEVTITLSRGGTITGRILGIATADLPFVEVRVSGSRTRTSPDATGAFTLNGVADGQVVLWASVSRPRQREAHAMVRVVNGIAPPVDLDFNAGIPVRGRVTLGGHVIEGFIRFDPAARRPGMSGASGQIGRDGTYEVRLASAGEYQVNLNRMGTNGMISAGRVNVTGEMVHDIDVRGATMSGVVADAVTRQPLAGVSVSLDQGRETRTNGAGRFTFDLIADGEYRVRAHADRYAPVARPVSVANGNIPEIELLLSRGQPAQFRVLDAATGQLVEMYSVAVSDASKSQIYFGEAPADASGMRTITLNPGTYELRVFARDYSMKAFTLTVPGPPLDVKLERPKR